VEPAALTRAAGLVPYAFAKGRGVAVTALGSELAEVAVREDASPMALAELRRVLGVPLRARRVSAGDFEQLIAALYSGANGSAAALAGDLAQDLDLSRLLQEIPKVEDLLESQDDAPVIRLLNALLTQALRDGASDIHIEPYESRSLVRLRIDGVLRDLIEPARALHAAIVSRVKIMAQLDIAEKRLPQDGRITLRVAGRPVDVRVSTIPTGHGERVVLRLLDKQAGRLDLTGLGMDDATLAQMDQLIGQPHGIILVTGPTGSGKTTTLYAALGRLDAGELNIMTVEDPIEYDLDGISQTQVNPRIDMSFARALRTILRQDPDVVMIGEIRDLETAQIAVQASLTGHLVFATLHTNDAVSAVNRLVDMGVEPFLLASSLIGVLAQRLVRRLCPECRKPFVRDGTTYYAPQGCPACSRSGYRGRTGIYEMLLVDDALRSLIHDRASEQRLRDHALAHGMRPLREDGMRWVLQGATSLEEIVRVTRD
jgi:general secretion pathway protein E